MTNTKNRAWLCGALWAATALWLAVIWLFSAQPGVESEGTSGRLVQLLLDWLSPRADGRVFATLEYLLRKTAHMSEYAVLACLFVLALRVSHIPHPVHFAFTLSMLTAILDECHQLFVPGRSGQVGDVVIDMIGACAGLFVFCLIRAMVRAGRQRKARRTVRKESEG